MSLRPDSSAPSAICCVRARSRWSLARRSSIESASRSALARGLELASSSRVHQIGLLPRDLSRCCFGVRRAFPPLTALTQHLVLCSLQRRRATCSRSGGSWPLALGERRPELGDPSRRCCRGRSSWIRGRGARRCGSLSARAVKAWRASSSRFSVRLAAGLQRFEARVLHVHRVEMLVVGFCRARPTAAAARPGRRQDWPPPT